MVEKKPTLAQLQELEHKFSKSAYPKVLNQVHCLTSLRWPHYPPPPSCPGLLVVVRLIDKYTIIANYYPAYM